MALHHQYTVVCEYARLEAGGKWIIIGLYPNGIGTPVVPFPLPMLTFFQVLRADAPGQFKFKTKLRQLDTGFVLAQAEGVAQIAQPAPLVMPVSLGNLQFKAFGLYTWSLEIDGQDPFVTEFEIMHIPQNRINAGIHGF